MLFLIHYNRPQGSLISIQEFSEKDMKGASIAKMQLEISLLGSGLGQEVVLLEADSQEELRKTHRRYFDTLQELGASTDRGPHERVGAKPIVNIDIRRAVLTDVPSIRRLQEMVLSPQHPRDYDKHIGSPNCENLVAFIGGEMVGYISVLMTINDPSGSALWHRLTPYVGFVGVLPEYQRRGVCRTLLRDVLKRLRADQLPEIVYLECSHENLGVFEKLGFKRLNNGFVQRKWGVTPKSYVMQLG